MFIKIALSAAIVLGAAATAATKSSKIAVHRSGPPAQSTVPRTPRFSNPDSPAATGGGSLGYNQNAPGIDVRKLRHEFSLQAMR